MYASECYLLFAYSHHAINNSTAKNEGARENTAQASAHDYWNDGQSKIKLHIKIGNKGTARWLFYPQYRAARFQSGRSSNLLATVCTWSMNIQQNGASIPITMRPITICMTDDIRQNRVNVNRPNNPKSTQTTMKRGSEGGKRERNMSIWYSSEKMLIMKPFNY